MRQMLGELEKYFEDEFVLKCAHQLGTRGNQAKVRLFSLLVLHFLLVAFFTNIHA